MLFNSLSFLIFFPIVTFIYFLIPQRAKTLWLLLCSYYFYMSWNPMYAFLIALSTVLTYSSGLAMARFPDRKKTAVAVSFILNLGILALFKYSGFITETLNWFTTNFGITLSDPAASLILPVGISFYTFQALSYTMDVYRGDIKVEYNFIRYALFVSFFPQLVAGPIERSKNLLTQINKPHKFDWFNARDGLLLMLWGLFIKMVIADRAALLVNTVFADYSLYGAQTLVIAALLFAVQLYVDFHSYSIIAKGAAQVLGFNLMENFKQPLFARSVTDFWRRWHISLSGWFRDYLYFPLGGSRKGKLITYRNTMIIFLVSGLWHGANWTYVIWGAMYGVLMVIEKMFYYQKKENPARYAFLQNKYLSKLIILPQIALTCILTTLVQVVFRSETLEQSMTILTKIFTLAPNIEGSSSLLNLGINMQNFIVLAIAFALLIYIDLRKEFNKASFVYPKRKDSLIYGLKNVLVAILLIFAIIIFGIYGPDYSASQFIYFQF